MIPITLKEILLGGMQPVCMYVCVSVCAAAGSRGALTLRFRIPESAAAVDSHNAHRGGFVDGSPLIPTIRWGHDPPPLPSLLTPSPILLLFTPFHTPSFSLPSPFFMKLYCHYLNRYCCYSPI